MSMQSDFEPHKDITWGGPGNSVGTVNYGNRNTMVVMFYNKSVENAAESAKLGRRFAQDTIFVRIHPPGERLNIIDRPATQADANTWPNQWGAFQRNHSQIPDGTPVDLLFPSQPSIADNLRGSGVHTVEQLAELSSDAIHNIMGGQTYVNKARQYIEQANKGVTFHKFQKELNDRDGQIRTLTQQLQLQGQEIERLSRVISGAGALAMQGAQAEVGGRPVMPNGRQMAPTFDTQSQQINANHPTHEIADVKTKKKSSKK